MVIPSRVPARMRHSRGPSREFHRISSAMAICTEGIALPGADATATSRKGGNPAGGGEYGNCAPKTCIGPTAGQRLYNRNPPAAATVKAIIILDMLADLRDRLRSNAK